MILGLDMATKKTGFCLMNEDKTIYHYGLIRTEGSETKERMKEIYQSIKTIVEKYDIAHIVLEDVPVNNHNIMSVINKMERGYHLSSLLKRGKSVLKQSKNI